LATELWSGALPSPPWTSGDAYYDAAELPLAPGNRSKRLAALRIAAVGHTDNCSDGRHLYTEHFLYGLSIWPNFRVTNAQGQPVVRKSQTTGHDHGGYLFGNDPVGTRRTTNRTACQVASMAMAYTYAGFDCTVDSLNAFLQRTKGYEPALVAIVSFVSPSGDLLGFTPTGKDSLEVGDTFLVEHGTYTEPLATYKVTVAGPNGQASRFGSPYSATIPSIGDPGRVYWRMKRRVADTYTHSPRLHSIDLSNSSQLAAQVESLLVRDIPVQLNVRGHFVVADGWTSSFRPGGSPRGTYFIKDPYDLGRRMLRDAGSGEDLNEIPDAVVEDVSSEHDNGGDLDDPLTGYGIDFEAAFDGHYTIQVYSDDGLSMSASAYDANGVFASDEAADTTAGPTGNVYDVLFDGFGRSVVVSHVSTLDVGSIPFGRGLLRVRRCPTTGPVEFALTDAEPTGDAIDVFDIRGRRVDVVQMAPGPGTQTVSWDWRLAGCRPGVYLARLRSRIDNTTRFVVLH
jgi:hypothetical protein